MTLPPKPHKLARVYVAGVGGGGSNAVNRMYLTPMRGVEVDYLVINTDAVHLNTMSVSRRVSIGDRVTNGRGAGGNPEVGRAAALESRAALAKELNGADLVFIAAGMGGGTGTGGAPVIAELAREAGALTVAVVTTPFTFEGARRARTAQAGVDELARHVDTMIVIPNDRLLTTSRAGASTAEAFRIADDVLRLGVQSIAELVAVPGDIILDFDELRHFMKGAGTACMGTGTAAGHRRAVNAALNALSSPVLDGGIHGARGVLFNVTASADVSMPEVREAVEAVRREAGADCEVLFGMVTDPAMEDEVRVTLVATGVQAPAPSPAVRTPHELGAIAELLDEIGELASTMRETRINDAREALAEALEGIIGSSPRVPLTGKMLVDGRRLREAIGDYHRSGTSPSQGGEDSLERIALLVAELRQLLWTTPQPGAAVGASKFNS